MESGILTLRDTETNVSGDGGVACACGRTIDDACRSAESNNESPRRREDGLGMGHGVERYELPKKRG